MNCKNKVQCIKYCTNWTLMAFPGPNHPKTPFQLLLSACIHLILKLKTPETDLCCSDYKNRTLSWWLKTFTVSTSPRYLLVGSCIEQSTMAPPSPLPLWSAFKLVTWLRTCAHFGMHTVQCSEWLPAPSYKPPIHTKKKPVASARLPFLMFTVA